MTGYLYLIAAVGFIGWTACVYWLGRIDGVAHEKRRAAHIRRMVQNPRG